MTRKKDKNIKHILLKLDVVEDKDIIDYINENETGSLPGYLKYVVRRYAKIDRMMQRSLEQHIMGGAKTQQAATELPETPKKEVEESFGFEETDKKEVMSLTDINGKLDQF